MKRLHRFDVLAAWYEEHLTVSGYRPRTVADYCFELSFFRRFLEERTTIADIDELAGEQLRQYVSWLYERQLATTTIHHKCAALLNFLGAIYEENRHYLDLRPHISLPKLGRTLPRRLLTEEQTAGLFAVLESATDALTVRALADAVLLRDHAVMELLYSTGMRLSELVGMRIGDIDLDRGVVHIRDGKGGKDRVIPLGAKSAAVVRRYVEESRRFLIEGDQAGDRLLVTRFGRAAGRQTIYDTLKRVEELSGQKLDLSPHAFRHACATHMLNRGADIRFVQELLGHASLSSTQVYTHVSIGKLKATHQRYHPREKGEPDNGI